MPRLPFELLLALRYLRPKRTFVSVITLIAVIGVMLGVTVLIVEHDMEVIFSICDRITVLASGRTLAEGNAAEIQGNAEVVRAYLGSAAA